MIIKDLNGEIYEVTDLPSALEQAEYFKDCVSAPARPDLDRRMRIYWTDLYEKLSAIACSKQESKTEDKH